MKTTSWNVPVLFSPDHIRHAPIFEYDRGLRLPYQEIPRRVEAAKEKLAQLPYTRLVQPVEGIPESAITAIHSVQLITYLKQTSQKASEWVETHLGEDEVYFTPWIYPLNRKMREGLISSPEPGGCYAFDLYAPIGANTWQAVLSSANLAYHGAKMILAGEANLVYALCRPPGHHAGFDYTGGYCYLNNAAIAAHQLSALGIGSILDIDYHHGNGTQDIFWDNPAVNYVSIHADPRFEYPFFAGFADETGGKPAPDATLNLPLPMGSGDTLYLSALDQAVEYIRKRGSKWLVLSAGYDTCRDDPSTSFSLSDLVYERIGRKIASLNLPVLVVHEGGYAVEKNGELSVHLLNGLFEG